MSRNDLPDKLAEYTRYQEHDNDVEDKAYQNFVRPIVDAVLSDFEETHIGLDFGAGPGPVVSKLLRDKNYNTELYDPFYHNNPKVLDRKYDYIVACEVIEHFHKPADDFKLMKNLLKENGKLYCKTNIFKQNLQFLNWHYRNDLTHVFFYREETFEFIFRYFDFSDYKLSDNLIIFSK